MVFGIVSGEDNPVPLSVIEMETGTSTTSSRQSRGVLRVPRVVRKVKKDLVDNVMNDQSRSPKDRGQSLKRKVERTHEERNPHVKLVRLCQKQMDQWTNYNSEIMHHDGDLRVDTFQQPTLSESTSENKVGDKTDCVNPKPIVDKPAHDLKDSKSSGKHSTVLKKSDKNKPKPKLNIQVAPIARQTVLDKVKPVASIPSLGQVFPIVSKSSCDKVVPSVSKAKCDKVVPSVSKVSNEAPVIPVAMKSSSDSRKSKEKLMIQIKPLVKAVPKGDAQKGRKCSVEVSTMSGNSRSKNLGSVNDSLISGSKEKLMVKIAPVSSEVAKEPTPRKASNMKKLKLFWENFTVKAKAVSNARTKPSQKPVSKMIEISLPDDLVTSGRDMDKDAAVVVSDPPVPSTSQQDDDTATLPSPQPCKTPTKTPAKRGTPATPKSPQEVLQDYTKTVVVSKSKSPSLSCKSSKLYKYQHEMDSDSPGKWGKKSFRRLFPDPPANEEPSPDALDSQKSKKKRSTKKRSLMSLNPAMYSQFFSPPPADSVLDTSMATPEPVANRSIEASRSVAGDSFMVSEMSIEDSVALPNQPSCVDSLNGVEMSSLISNGSELESSMLDNSTVKRAITETAADVFGSNDSTVLVNDRELSDRDFEQSVVMSGHNNVEVTDDVHDNQSIKEKESEVIIDEVLTNNNVDSKNLDDVTRALVEELLNLSESAVNREMKDLPVEKPWTEAYLENENASGNVSQVTNQDLFLQLSENLHYTSSIDHEEVVPMIVDDVKSEPEIHHEEVVPMVVDDTHNQELENHTGEAKPALLALDTSNDEPPPLFSAVSLDDLQPPVLSPHPCALETLNRSYTQSSTTLSSQDSADDIPDLISPLYSLKPPALSPHPACLEKLKSADQKAANHLNPQVMPVVNPPIIEASTRGKPATVQNQILSLVASKVNAENNEQATDTAMNLTCYELHDKENIPDSTHNHLTAATHTITTESQFSPSYLSSSQLMWSPTPVTESSPQPQVLSNRKSIKRPRKLVFDNTHDQASKPPVPKRATPSKKLSGKKEKSSATLYQIARNTSSIGKLSQLVSPKKCPVGPVSSTSVKIGTPTESTVLTHEKPVSTTPVTSDNAIQSTLTRMNQSSVNPDATVNFQVPSVFQPSSVQGPASAGPVVTSSRVQTFLIQHDSSNAKMQVSAAQQGGMVNQSSQQKFFGPDFVPVYTMAGNSSVCWKQYEVRSMTYTSNANLPVTTPDRTAYTSDVRATPEGSENARRHYTAYRRHSEKSAKVQQFLTSTPVSADNTTARTRVQENRPIDCAAQVNAPVSTALPATQSNYTRSAAQEKKQMTSHGSSNSEQFSLFDHLTNSVSDRLNGQLIQRKERLYGDVIQTDMRSQGVIDLNPSSASSGHGNTQHLNYQQTLGPMSQQNYLHVGSIPEGTQNADQLNQGMAFSQPVHGFDQNYWQNQQTELTPDTFVSSLLPALQHLKPYTISGWISSTYLQALIQKTDVLNDMFDHALDWKGDIEEWVVENCKKSTPAVLARDLVFRIMTLEELERSIIWKQSMRSIPRTRLAAIRRCLQKQFPKSFDNKAWKECLTYIRSSVNVLFRHRVPQVQNFWLMHHISNM